MARRTPEHPGANAFIPDNLPKSAARSLTVLADAAQHCRGCDLYKDATQAVFGEGPPTARIVLIGEQPGDQEDVAGHPSIGPAGKLLDRALLAAGLARSDCYVTNAVKHFKWKAGSGTTRRLHAKPNTVEMRACKPWLDHELALIGPSVVVMLGAAAGQALLGGEFRISKQRGQIIRDSPLAPAIIATHHPSAALRAIDHDSRARIERQLTADLATAASIAGTG